ncbi:MAG: hypothetical protein J5858_05935 [Lentisphaeria bacterium]|nr:hypothetical protein [Lentisphaeria bacterium]
MRKIKKSFFTLLEVLVSMGVFSLLMLALMQFFSAAQGVWERTGNKAELFESAKTAMDILANDLACIYYEQDYDQSLFKFFDISTSDTSKIAFAAQKEDGNAAIFYKWDSSTWKLHRVEKKESDIFETNVANPNITWSEGKTTGWFTRSGNSNWIGDAGIASTNLTGSDYCLAENVLDFTICAYAKNNLTTKIAPTNQKPLPDVILVSMVVLSNDAHEKLLNRFASESDKAAAIRTLFNTTTFQYIKSDGTDSGESDMKTVKEMLVNGTPPSGGDDTNQAILFNGCQRFTRVIPLDRGQN